LKLTTFIKQNTKANCNSIVEYGLLESSSSH